MVLGDHGRKVLAPMTLTQEFAMFPWSKFYKNSTYFRFFCGTGLALATGWAYIVLRGNFILFLVKAADLILPAA